MDDKLKANSNIKNTNSIYQQVANTKYYNKMVNNMLMICSELCIKDFIKTDLNSTEKTCVENCQKKYYLTNIRGRDLVGKLIDGIGKEDLFSFTNEVDFALKYAKN